MKKKGLLLAISCILIGFIYRMLPLHPANVTPIAAMALVGGLYLNKRLLAFCIPLVALFASDLILNNTVNRVFFADHSGLVIWDNYMFWTYGAFILTVVIGMLLAKSSPITKIAGGTLAASVLFFVVSNFGSWLALPMYTKDASGLMTCYAAAIPFFRNTLLGNLVFVTAFVGSIEYLMSRKPAAQIA